jgi:hypothetical protein
MVLQPKGNRHIDFERGGVSLTKAPTKVWLTFHTRNNRVISEVPFPYYLFSKDNERECEPMVKTAWKNAASMAPEKVFSRPEDEKITTIVSTIKELLKAK